jgi:hypothetical protein
MTPTHLDRKKSRQKAVDIVTLDDTNGVKDFEDLKRGISQIAGVKKIDFDNLTYKLLVEYEGQSWELPKIKAVIDRLLEGRKAKRKNAHKSIPRQASIRQE